MAFSLEVSQKTGYAAGLMGLGMMGGWGGSGYGSGMMGPGYGYGRQQ